MAAGRSHTAVRAAARRSLRCSQGRCAMRIWVDLTNSPHVLVMRPVIRALEGRGAQVRVTARDFAQTLGLLRALRHRARGDRPPPRRPAGGEGRSGWRRARSRSRAGRKGRRFDVALGHGSNDVTVAAKLLGIPSATTFDYEWATVQHTRQLPARPARRRARRDPARAARALRRDRAQAAPLPGAQGGVLPRGLRARPGRARRARARRRRRRSPSSARRPPSRSTTASSTRCSRQLLERLREQAQVVVLPRTPEQRAELAAAGGFVVPERAVDAQSLVALRRRRRVGGRDDEPRGGRARHAGVDDVRGPARRGRRAADRRGPAAPARARGGRRGGQARAAPVARPPSACAATPRSFTDLLVDGLDRGCLAARSRVESPRMRRRIRSAAAFPFHRHSLPQVAVDAGLVALAYYLAYQLRFDGDVPRALLGPVRAHDRVRRRRQRVRVRAVRPVPALDALRDPARLPADRAGRASSRRSRCSPTSRSSSRGCEFDGDALHVGQRARPACSCSTGC